jgi:hypothetical protein
LSRTLFQQSHLTLRRDDLLFQFARIAPRGSQEVGRVRQLLAVTLCFQSLPNGGACGEHCNDKERIESHGTLWHQKPRSQN